MQTGVGRKADEPGNWTKGVIWVLGLLLPLAGVGLAAYMSLLLRNTDAHRAELARRVGVLEGTLAGLVISCAETKEHVAAHDRDADRYKDIIDGLHDDVPALASRVNATEIRIESLMSPGGPGERFTSTQAGAHWDSIVDNQQCCRDTEIRFARIAADLGKVTDRVDLCWAELKNRWGNGWTHRHLGGEAKHE